MRLVLVDSEEEQAQGPDAASAVPEEDQGPGRRGDVGAAGAHRPQGGGQGAADAGGHGPAAALVRGEDEQAQGRYQGRLAAQRPRASLLPCTLKSNEPYFSMHPELLF